MKLVNKILDLVEEELVAVDNDIFDNGTDKVNLLQKKIADDLYDLVKAYKTIHNIMNVEQLYDVEIRDEHFQ